ncbi:pyridine nucleotide-disulfide oxidoreductase [Bacteroidia bacterium]|nr:pyridine nucleotide-disulfide oxidoreductase [Bacteroidia bacterium]
MEKKVSIAIIGGGPAGLAAAVSCYEHGVKDIVIIERDTRLGGILQQCIHNGFGLHTFQEELTGPEYAERYMDKVEEYGIETLLDTMVLELGADRVIRAINPRLGLVTIHADAVILCTGCRERTRANLKIPGNRGAGILSAGLAQRLTNIEGYMPGKEIVILGSGDIGLIMARRLKFEGANIKCVVELMPYSTGLQRNIRQCLEDFDIPLLFEHTVVDITGAKRVEGVTIAQVDKNRKPIKETERYIPCDTLLLSVGLIPENEIALGAGVAINPLTNGPVVDGWRMTNVSGIFACGNTLHVHDLVDYVSEEAHLAAQGAVRYVGQQYGGQEVEVRPGGGIRYVVPNRLDPVIPIELYFRPDNVYHNGTLKLMAGDEVILEKKFIKLTPGEMDRVRVTEETLQKIDDRPLSLACK